MKSNGVVGLKHIYCTILSCCVRTSEICSETEDKVDFNLGLTKSVFSFLFDEKRVRVFISDQDICYLQKKRESFISD